MNGVVPAWLGPRRGSRAGLAVALLALGGLTGPPVARAELFVSSADTDEVLRYADSGAFLGVFASGNGLVRPQGLAFGLDGHLYVASSGAMDSKILRYHGATGAFLGAFVATNSGDLSLPRGLAFGPDGHLYVASENNNRVLRYHGVTGAFLGAATPLDPAEEPKSPRGLAFGPEGRLYVASFGDGRVKRYDPPADATADVFVEFDAGEGRPDSPFDLTFGPDGHLYLGTDGNNAVLRYDGGTGAFIDEFVTAGDGGLMTPRGVVFGPDGRLHVASRDNDRVLRFDGGTGTFIDTLVPEGSGGLDFPTFLAFRRPSGRTLCVRPGGTAPDFASIQAALDAARLGDTIRVAAGTYQEHVTVARTVTLLGGWDATCAERDPVAFVSTIRPPAVISPGTDRSVVQVGAAAPVIDGFTITGSRADLGGQHGGGLALRDTHATVRNSVITGNKASFFGGGIWVQRGAPRLEGNRIEGNEVPDANLGLDGGGGVYLENTRATLVENLIQDNVTSPGGGGGGILVNGGGPVVLERNLVLRNRSATGAGILAEDVTEVNGGLGLTIRGGELSSNIGLSEPDCLGSAAGLRATASEVAIDGLVARDNCRTNGVLELDSSFFSIKNVLIVDNRTGANPQGTGILIGGAAFNGSDLDGSIVNSTLRGDAHGILVNDGVRVAVANSILVGHAVAAIYVNLPANVSVTASAFFGNAADGVNVTPDAADGNLLGVDPLLDADLAPRPGSPVIDAGTNAGCPADDLRGTPRPRDGNGDGVATCDMGAFEGPTVVVPLDLDGDRRADIGVFRAAGGEWRLVGSTAGSSTVVFGQSGDWPVPGDYDGDGRVDLAVYRRATGQFVVQGTTAGLLSLVPGSPGGLPVPADYDGDAVTDAAVYHPATGLWQILGSAAGPLAPILGGPGAAPVPADYDGDGKADPAVFRAATGEWRIAGSAAVDLTVVLGGAGPGLVPTPADYDGDGRADPAVFQPAGARAAGQALWRLQRSTAGLLEVSLGEVKAGATPVPADYDGDGLSDVAVFERATGAWRVLGSSAGPLTLTTGTPRRGEIPVGLDLSGR